MRYFMMFIYLVMSWKILSTGGMKEKFNPLTLIVSGFLFLQIY